jgi:signal transduction histidine kinase
LTTTVLDTAHPARIETYDDATGYGSDVARSHGLRSAVGAPILVEGRLWGLVIAGMTGDEPLPSDAEERLAGFTELVATAISNAQAQSDLTTLAEQQAALRRVATLVAENAPPAELFSAVATEASRLLGMAVGLCRYEQDDTATMVGAHGSAALTVGSTWPLEGPSLLTTVHRTGKMARIDDSSNLEGAAEARDSDFSPTIGAPIVVRGTLWGVIGAAPKTHEPIDDGAALRLAEFTELVATAISNAAAREELLASRARIVAAGDDARRQIERNLHDGTQQRLIALGLDLQRARAAIPEDDSDIHSTLTHVEEDLEAILLDLRELSHGLHPPLLSRLGLGPSLQALARRSPIPVQLDVDLLERPAVPLETAVYYVVSEALTNAIKHSHASEISVGITSGEKLRASIVDDGVGDADPSQGSGLTGLVDRVEALGGRFALDSPPRGGTRISIEFPVEPTVAA